MREWTRKNVMGLKQFFLLYVYFCSGEKLWMCRENRSSWASGGIGYREEGMLETDEGHDVAYNYALGCNCDDTSGEELGLMVFPMHTKVLVTSNNQTKSVLLGLHGVVKKAMGLGGWHHAISCSLLLLLFPMVLLSILFVISIFSSCLNRSSSSFKCER